jgi:hypothetical protein
MGFLVKKEIIWLSPFQKFFKSKLPIAGIPKSQKAYISKGVQEISEGYFVEGFEGKITGAYINKTPFKVYQFCLYMTDVDNKDVCIQINMTSEKSRVTGYFTSLIGKLMNSKIDLSQTLKLYANQFQNKAKTKKFSSITVLQNGGSVNDTYVVYKKGEKPRSQNGLEEFKFPKEKENENPADRIKDLSDFNGKIYGFYYKIAQGLVEKITESVKTIQPVPKVNKNTNVAAPDVTQSTGGDFDDFNDVDDLPF